VVHDRQVEHFGVFHCPAHDLIALHTFAVVGHRDHAGLLELAGGGELLAVHPDGQATGRVNMDDRVARDFVHDALAGTRIVADPTGDGHADHGGKTARSCGARATGDVLFVRLARITEMHVNIDQPRCHYQAAGIDPGGGRVLGIVQVLDQHAVHGKNIADGIALIGGVDDPSVLYPKDFLHEIK